MVTDTSKSGATTGVPEVAHARDRVLHCIVVTPEATVFEHPAQFIVLPLFDGEVGIAPGHTPLIGRLGYGELRLTEAGQTTRLYIDGGFAQVADNVVSVLTQRAIRADKLDPGAIETQLHEAQQRPAHSPETMELRDRAVRRARAQLRIARRAKGISTAH